MIKEEQQVRFGVIGCGAMPEQVHCANLAAIPGVRIAAFCDLEESKARKLSDVYGGEYVTTRMEEVFADQTIDAVTICAGPRFHAPIVQAAAKAGKHIFVEKPLTDTLSVALETMRVVEAAGVKFIHGTCNRLAPSVITAKRLSPQPVYTFAQAGSTVTHMPVHQIDLTVNLFHEAPIVRVYASGGQVWNDPVDKQLPADSYAAILTFADGSVNTYFQHGNVINSLKGKYHYELYDKESCVFLANRYKECHHIRKGKVERSWTYESADSGRGPFGYMGHYEELLDLVTCIRHGGTPTMTVRQAAYTCAVEKAILKSIEIGAAVQFREFLGENDALTLLEGR